MTYWLWVYLVIISFPATHMDARNRTAKVEPPALTLLTGGRQRRLREPLDRGDLFSPFQRDQLRLSANDASRIATFKYLHGRVDSREKIDSREGSVVGGEGGQWGSRWLTYNTDPIWRTWSEPWSWRWDGRSACCNYGQQESDTELTESNWTDGNNKGFPKREAN